MLAESGLLDTPPEEVMFGHAAAAVIGVPVAEVIVPHRYREAHVRGVRRFHEEGIGPILGRQSPRNPQG
jgi:hypothetical protein